MIIKLIKGFCLLLLIAINGALNQAHAFSKPSNAEGGLSYDRLNRPVLLTDADNKTVQTGYDAVDNKLSETDKRGNTWGYEYDELDRIKLTTEPTAGSHSNTITQVYDANDNPTQTTDKRGIVTDVDYDRLNRVIEERRSGIVVMDL